MKKQATCSRTNISPLATLSIFCLLLFSGCAIKPPQEKGDFKDSDLVELVKLDSTIHLDIRYATNNNLVGRAVYTQARAFLQKPAAASLVKVNEELKPLGYGLLVFDGYRPWSVTKLFWDITPKKDRKFVANPNHGSRHNRGCAVDLTLYKLNSGKEVEMTSEYDEMSERSFKDYSGGTTQQRKLRDLLISKMEKNGFKGLESEWWHFDFNGWQQYRIQNVQFSEIK
ncbi:MAG TPA: M15 family metallopeptidase [Pelobium sp.]